MSRDTVTKKDRSADLALLDKLTARAKDGNPDAEMEEAARAQIFREVSQKHFDDFVNFKPVPYWGTERK